MRVPTLSPMAEPMEQIASVVRSWPGRTIRSRLSLAAQLGGSQLIQQWTPRDIAPHILCDDIQARFRNHALSAGRDP